MLLQGWRATLDKLDEAYIYIGWHFSLHQHSIRMHCTAPTMS